MTCVMPDKKKKTILNLWVTLSPSDFVRRPLNNIKKKKKNKRSMSCNNLNQLFKHISNHYNNIFVNIVNF